MGGKERTVFIGCTICLSATVLGARGESDKVKNRKTQS